ncbi:MAG TPA: hypothetical protein VE995_03000 [Gaiellaceae bacterium]|nr:hypothetical protein [Gaiellaceae bacterium]
MTYQHIVSAGRVLALPTWEAQLLLIELNRLPAGQHPDGRSAAALLKRGLDRREPVGFNRGQAAAVLRALEGIRFKRGGLRGTLAQLRELLRRELEQPVAQFGRAS